MEVLGHSQISLTMDTYSHVIPEVQQDAAEMMNALTKGKKLNAIGTGGCQDGGQITIFSRIHPSNLA